MEAWGDKEEDKNIIGHLDILDSHRFIKQRFMPGKIKENTKFNTSLYTFFVNDDFQATLIPEKFCDFEKQDKVYK